MDLEIWLDTEEADPANYDLIQKRFMEWYTEGAEVRHNKMSFGKLERLERENRYVVDLGYSDLLTSFRNLHARLHRLGVKVFIHFLP
ncbi:MAG: hypothetical protein KAJ60_02895 [Desulfobulbaceae bacterium]|nr:hypothetical protein [Desulfobulbaceae bacterium]MCK5339990.1 hypothetical protein [Desulfobulbaceae bacterium]MCK5403786.1 hypothetical protein [Desulfobulbaceae bacterium]